MTLGELHQALHDVALARLPERVSPMPVYVEDTRGELHELQSVEVETEHVAEGLLVLKFKEEVADV